MYLFKRSRLILRGPIHFLLVIFLYLSTYFYYSYLQDCLPSSTFACPTRENVNLIFKAIIAITQLLGIALLLWDIDKKMQTLTGTKLRIYFLTKFKSWLALWRDQKNDININSTFPLPTTCVSADFIPEKQDESIEEKLLKIEGLLKIHQSAIARNADLLRGLDVKVQSELDLMRQLITSSSDEVLGKVTAVHVGGYTGQVWSICLIAYSAILSIFI